MPVSNDWVKKQKRRNSESEWDPISLLDSSGKLTLDDKKRLQSARVKDNHYSDTHYYQDVVNDLVKKHHDFLSQINHYNPYKPSMITVLYIALILILGFLLWFLTK